MDAYVGQSAISRSANTAFREWTDPAFKRRTSVLVALALAACFLVLPLTARAQVNPEIANCSELKDEATILQADLCSAHIGCRFVMNVQKTCARTKSYLDRLKTAIGEGTRTLFGTRKEITPEAVFTAVLNDETRSNDRKLDTLPESRQLSQEIAARVREVGHGDTLTSTNSYGYSWVYYGQTKEGRQDGWGTVISSSGFMHRKQYTPGLMQSRSDILYPGGGRSVIEYVVGAPTMRGTTAYEDGTIATGVWHGWNNLTIATGAWSGETLEGKKYRADGTLSAQGRFDKTGLLVGTAYDAAGVPTAVNVLAERESVARAAAAAEQQRTRDEEQRKRAQAAQAEQQFRASLQTMNPGQLFARADEFNAQGDRDRAREVQRALMSRFPDHPLAATAARQMAGNTTSPPATGGGSGPAGTPLAANRPTGGRLTNQECKAMEQSVIATKVPPNASVTAAMETVMFMTKTTIDMIDGDCPTSPGVTQSQVAEERKARLQQYKTAEQNCNAVQSGGHRCVARAHAAGAPVSNPPTPSSNASANRSVTISYDPVTGQCRPIGAPECCQLPNYFDAHIDCRVSRSSSGRGVRTAR